MNNLINEARHIPVNEATPTVSVSPVTLTAPNRGLPIELRVTAPTIGRDLPIILLSHGHGPSLYLPSKDGYSPIVNFYADDPVWSEACKALEDHASSQGRVECGD